MATKNIKAPTVIDESLALSILPRREPKDHKWSVGGVVIVGGAPGYVGAPALCARAAMRSGAGIVTIAAARSTIGPIAGIVPEATFVPLPEGDPVGAATRGAEALRERVEKSRAIVAGPGMSEDDHASALLAVLFGMRRRQGAAAFGFGRPSSDQEHDVSSSILGGEKPAVIDADGLNWLAKQPEWWTNVAPQSLILTPHLGEMARLVDRPVTDIGADPVETAREAARAWNQTVLLKGAPSVLTNGETVLVGEVSATGLASAGTGDVLAGSIGAFLAQGLSLMDAGALAMYAGLKAAQAVEAEFGALGLMAGDLPDAIARALADLERRRSA